MAVFTITEDSGTFRVRKGRHLLPEPFTSEDEALKRIDVLKAPGDKVVVEEEDGYRRSVKRKHWRGSR